MLALLLSLLQATPLQTQVGQISVVASGDQLALATRLAEWADHPQDWPGLGRRPTGRIRLIIVADAAELEAVSSGRAPSWGAGVALPGTRTIILRADAGQTDQTFRHELAHLALHDAVRVRLPLWFDEGYASWASGEWDRLESLRLNLAVASSAVPELRELDGLLRSSANAADMAYGLAASAVIELARRHPSGQLDSLMAHLERGEGFEPSVIATTGLTLSRFDEEWRRSVRRRYNLLTWLVAGGMWAVVAAGLGVMLWYRRRIDRPRRAALDEGWLVVPDAEGRLPNELDASAVDPTQPMR